MSGNRTALLLVFVTVFIDLLGFGIVLPLLPVYGKAFDADKEVLGLLMASFSAMQFVFAPIWGRISDRVGRRPILLLGLAGSTASYALFGYATSLGKEGTILGASALAWLFISRIGAGIAGATIPTAQAYIADVTDAESRGKGMALIGAAFGIGFTFGPLIGAAFVSAERAALPSPMPGYVAAALSGVAFLFALARLPESLQPGKKTTTGHWLNPADLRAAVAKPSIGMILLAVFLTTFAFGQFEATLALLVREALDYSDRHIFYVFAYVGLVLSISQGGIVRRLIPKLGEYKVAVGGTAIMVLGLALVGLAAGTASSAMLLAVIPVSVLGFSAVTPSLQSLLSLRSGESEQGGILGLGQGISALARILGPFVGIVLFGRMGMSAPFIFGAGLMAVGLIAVAMLGDDRATDAAASGEATDADPAEGESAPADGLPVES